MLVIGCRFRSFALVLVFMAAMLVHVPSNFPTVSPVNGALAGDEKRPPALQIDDDISKLPAQVAEMREAILDAARRGDIDALLEPIQMNELKPNFGKVSAAQPIEDWKKLSIDGEGREILAILINILQSPYAVVREGPDIENNKLYIWPYFAEVPVDKLPPHLDVNLLQLIPREDYERMKQTGRYHFWQLAIGADGTWHSFYK